jgi:hypothetical protein
MRFLHFAKYAVAGFLFVMELGGCAGGMVGTVLNNVPYNHAETLSHVTSPGAGVMCLKTPNMGFRSVSHPIGKSLSPQKN